MPTILSIIYLLFIVAGGLFIAWRFSKQGMRRNRLLIVGLVLGVAMTYLVPMILSTIDVQGYMTSPVRYVTLLSPGAFLSTVIGFGYIYDVGQSSDPRTFIETLAKLASIFNAIAYAFVLDVVGVLYHRLAKKFKRQ